MNGPTTSQQQQQLIRTIRLDDASISKLLDSLDEIGRAHHPNRKSLRYRYRLKAVAVHMQQPGASTTQQYLVPTRNLSAEGISFLHGGFVHPGTRCMIQLITSHGTWNNVVGEVVRCDYVSNNIHEVALHFDQALDPSVYCAEAVHSRILLAEDDPAISRLATFHLEQLNASVDHAVNGREAVELAMKNPYDLILMDIEMPVLNGFDAVGELREKGYSGMIAAATALTGKDDREKCLQAGCDRYLPKPFAREDMEALIQSLREEPLFSSLADDPAMAELIDGFVRDLPAKIRALELAIVQNNSKELEVLTRGLKAQGTSFGFDVITEVATVIEKALLAGQDIEKIRGDVDRLVKFCMQARSSVNVTAAADPGK